MPTQPDPRYQPPNFRNPASRLALLLIAQRADHAERAGSADDANAQPGPDRSGAEQPQAAPRPVPRASGFVGKWFSRAAGLRSGS
jgi:hypothetical protein